MEALIQRRSLLGEQGRRVRGSKVQDQLYGVTKGNVVAVLIAVATAVLPRFAAVRSRAVVAAPRLDGRDDLAILIDEPGESSLAQPRAEVVRPSAKRCPQAFFGGGIDRQAWD